MSDLAAKIAVLTGSTVREETPLAGGSVADVRRIVLADGRELVAKRGAGLVVEARMLRYLAAQSSVPVPAVHHADADLLLMDYIPSGEPITDPVQEHAAQILASLHGITAPMFGLEFDTVIGCLTQPNARNRSWRAFFRDRRLLYMAEEARSADKLPLDLYGRIQKLAEHLDKWISEDAEPTLIHGDLWGGNLLARGGKLVGLVDPAISYSDPEIELAFTTLFGTFSKAFFVRYDALRPIAPGFFEERRDLYNLYPLLVHVRLFGGTYVGDVDTIVTRFGY